MATRTAWDERQAEHSQEVGVFDPMAMGMQYDGPDEAFGHAQQVRQSGMQRAL
ncbi:MAG: hypothetical protein WBM11_16085 [Terriglobales bacterium]